MACPYPIYVLTNLWQSNGFLAIYIAKKPHIHGRTSLQTSKFLLKWFNKYISPLQTDDKGVFSTSLSEEYQLAASTFDLQPSDLRRLSLSSIDSAFCDEQSKEKLREKWKLCKPQIEKRFNLKLESSGYQTQKSI